MKLLDSYPTEFYVSDVGYLVIKQECFECGHETMFLITPEQTKILFNLQQEIMQQQKVRWNGIYQPKEEDV
jgi:hypothetical protein